GNLPGQAAPPTKTAANSTRVAASATPSVYGQSVIYTATITNTSGYGGTPTGSVEFFDGSTDLGAGSALGGSGSSATSTFPISTLTVGSHSIAASFTDGTNFSSSTGSMTQTVNARTLHVDATGVNKVYDGTTAAPVT